MRNQLGIGCIIGLCFCMVLLSGCVEVAPIFVEGNPTCEDVCTTCDDSFKIEPVTGDLEEKTWSVGAGTVGIGNLVLKDGNPNEVIGFDWGQDTSNIVNCVIVKGGPNANVYHYESGISGGLHLAAPTNPENGQPFAISHIDFCYSVPETTTTTTTETTTTVVTTTTPVDTTTTPVDTTTTPVDTITTKTTKTTKPPVPVPEFPEPAIPAVALIGLAFVVVLIQFRN